MIFLILLLLFSPLAHAHIELTGKPPVISSCGSDPSIIGNDSAGSITIGSGVITGCTLTFNQAWTAAPICIVTSNSAAITGGVTAVSTSAFTAGFSAALGGGKLYYRCYGTQ